MRLLPLAALVTATLMTAAASAQTRVPRIVNGTPTGEYPTVGALLFYADPQRTDFEGLCSGTLIGCHTFLTAAHCICDEMAEDAKDCARFGLVDPDTIEVYLPHAGFVGVKRTVIHPSFVFAEAGDVAVLELEQPVPGIAPSTINTTARPLAGTRGTLVGFGRTGGRSFEEDDAGLKRQGPVMTASCDDEVPGANHICWRFEGTGSSTCSGDSGGPLFIPEGSGAVVAGTTSGGTRDSCLAPDFSFDTDVFVYRAFISNEAGNDLGEECDDGPVVGDDDVTIKHWTGETSAQSRQARVEFDVPSGATELRIGLNGQIFAGEGMFRDRIQFNLYVRPGAQPSPTTYECADERGSAFGFCGITAPQPGTWHVLINAVAGQGEWQLTATTFGVSTSLCTGDCDGSGAVTVDELVAAVTAALGTGELTCAALDVDENGVVTVEEIVAAVDNALGGCL